jgi:hypothetical protein
MTVTVVEALQAGQLRSKEARFPPEKAGRPYETLAEHIIESLLLASSIP